MDPILGPEMRSTGEVMGIDQDLGFAFVKAYQAAGLRLPKTGRVFVSVKNADKRAIVSECRTLAGLGYELVATEGTWRALKSNGIPVERVNKVHEGRPHVLDLVKNREVRLIINTPSGRQERSDDRLIRATAVTTKVPCITTLAAAAATVQALEWMRRRPLDVCPLQDHHAALAREQTAQTT